MVTDEELVTRLRDILRNSDLDTATPSSVRRQLEADLGIDLLDRKSFIREQIDVFLESQLADGVEEGDGNEAEVGEGSENGKDKAKLEVEEDECVKEEEGDDEDGDDSEGKGSKKTGSTNEDKVKKRGGFNKLCSLSPKLQEIVGETELSRPEVVKKMWAYIRKNDLQDPANKRNIRCDEALCALFRVKSINMFQMNKALTKHIWPLSTDDGNVNQNKKVEESDHSESEGENIKEEEREEVEEEARSEKGSRKQKRKGGSAKLDKAVKKRGGFTKLCSLSPQLQTFTGEAVLARTEVVKKLWAYIRENNLQDPKNKRNILCDESFRSLFNVDSIDMFQMNKALSNHIWPLNVEDAPANSSQKEKQSNEEEEEEDEDEDELYGMISKKCFLRFSFHGFSVSKL
ncbi:hypothetical protein UlMin_042867 [Ulmus minor]